MPTCMRTKSETGLMIAIGQLTCPPQALPPGVAGVVSCAPADLRDAAMRARLLQALGLQRIQFLRQVHGCQVVWADAERGGVTEPEADAVCTQATAVGCAILTADCLPVIFAAGDGSVVAAAHAGWRGLATGVLEATLSAMNVPAADCHVWLGPAIGQGSFEVGPEVRSAFMAAAEKQGLGAPDAIAEAFVGGRGDRWHGDLYALARARLQAADVGRIAGGGWDTFSDRCWHSFRRDGSNAGRQVTLVWRTGRALAARGG